LAAIDQGIFKEQIIPLQVKTIQVDENRKRVESVKTFDVDECPRRSTIQKMAELKPVFMRGGTVTPGNSSQMCDGAAAVVLMTLDKCKEKGLEPMARYVGAAAAGCPPEMMGIGPIYAVPKVMGSTGLKIQDMDLIEINEAFASQALACIRELGLDESKTNVSGGAIALGHPLGCTGAKLTVQLLYEMKRRRSRYGLVTMCIGGGQGMASIFENLS
jgi:acetyl-CoA acyltransferase